MTLHIYAFILRKIHPSYVGAYNLALAILLCCCLGSCTAFKQEKLFQSEGTVNSEAFDQSLSAVQGGYKIQKSDILAISVYPNNGEQLVDQTGDYPTNDEGNMMMGGQNMLRQQNQNMFGNQSDPIGIRRILMSNMRPFYYYVNENGRIDLPVVGKINAEGLTLPELDAILKDKYASYIKFPYIASQFVNKRVVLMGALGDHVIPLNNEGTSLLEVISMSSSTGNNVNNLALGNSFQRQAKASEVRIIRGEPGKRKVLLVDLTTMDGLNKLQTRIYPNDIIYIPPRRRFDRQTLTDISAVFTPILTALTLLTSVISLTSQ